MSPTRLVRHGFISKELCSELIDALERHRLEGKANTSIGGESGLLWMNSFPEPYIRDQLYDVANAIAQVASHLMQRTVEPETIYLAWLGAGAYHVAHCDNVRRDGQGGWEPNHTPQRVASTSLYLNDGSGPLCFADGERVEPAPGRLVVFRADETCEHWTEPVTEPAGRYLISGWFKWK